MPGELVIDFAVVADPRTPSVTVDSVARIDLIGERVVDGISIQPAIEGEWRWSNENRLSFRPAGDWPAGQRYTIRFDESTILRLLRGDAPCRARLFVLTRYASCDLQG